MSVNWGSAMRSKSLSFVYGSGWDRVDFKTIFWRKTPLGWDANIWRLSISYDNYGNVRKRT
jgi:hypothetical protein